MNSKRIKIHNKKEINQKGKYVLYWMQQSQRIEFNHALSYSIDRANELNLPLIVSFGLTDYPEANERHYFFMLEGLQELAVKMTQLGIKFILKLQQPHELALELSHKSALTVIDKAYLNTPKSWRSELIKAIKVPLIEVESDLIIPVETASEKEEYAAYTIRKKIHRQLDEFLIECNIAELKNKTADNFDIKSESLEDIPSIIEKLNIDRSVKKSEYLTGAYSQAKALLSKFIDEKLDNYEALRNDPTLDCTSHLSPYLHFGQISALEIALNVKNSGKNSESIKAYLEELIVRRELAFNFCYYDTNYDNLKGLAANWIYETLEHHELDKRDIVYSREEWELRTTHDEIWNACQKELEISGEMHAYMRMYWGKKILEWSENIEEAFDTAIYLNNKYAIDGRDANSFTGIAWCFGKHDRPWFERAVYGKIRYMNANGIRRKFKIDKYIARVNSM